jgi:hypothetical protein
MALGGALYVGLTLLAGAPEPAALRRLVPLPRLRPRRRLMTRPYRHRHW